MRHWIFMTRAVIGPPAAAHFRNLDQIIRLLVTMINREREKGGRRGGGRR